MNRDYDVAIIGLGPVGSFAALLLEKRGLKVLAIDKDKEIYSLPRAVSISDQGLRMAQEVDIDEIYIVGLGDLTENCTTAFYDSQPFNVELSLIEQYALARSMIMKTVDTFLPLADKITHCGVPGNHGEMSRSGKGQVFTDRLDNSDTMHLQICREIMSANPDRYSKVEVNIPEGFHQTVIIKGKKVSFTHGHMTGGSGNPENKIENWWKGQMYGWLPAGDAEILVTAHYHHLRMKQQGDRTWFQCPSIDASIDFTERTGLWSHPGVLSFTISDKGWDNYYPL